jgi:hypothetical protein
MSTVEKPIEDVSATGERRRPGSTELYADWAARMQRGRGRHAAINRNLNTWANYKNWSDKARLSWESDFPAVKPK